MNFCLSMIIPKSLIDYGFKTSWIQLLKKDLQEFNSNNERGKQWH